MTGEAQLSGGPRCGRPRIDAVSSSTVRLGYFGHSRLLRAAPTPDRQPPQTGRSVGTALAAIQSIPTRIRRFVLNSRHSPPITGFSLSNGPTPPAPATTSLQPTYLGHRLTGHCQSAMADGPLPLGVVFCLPPQQSECHLKLTGTARGFKEMGTLSKRSREVQDNSSDSEEDNYDETEKLASSEREEVDKLVEEGEEGEEEEEDSYDETEKLASSEGEEEEELVEDAEEEDHKEGDGYGPEDDEMAELEKEYMGLRHQEQDLLKNLKRYKEEDLLKGQAVKN